MTRVSRFEKRRPRFGQLEIPALLEQLGIQFKRDGRSLKALCPSHDDHDPSWSIVDAPGTESHGLHHCFSCEFGGGPVALVREVRGCTTEEAFEYLGAGVIEKDPVLDIDILVKPFSGALSKPKFVMPAGVSFSRIELWPKEARDYAEPRYVGQRDIDDFGLGVAETGRLRGRIVMPMYSWGANGELELESYTARDYTGQQRRYMEPKDSENAAKDALFGAHLWRSIESLIVVEGPFDAIAVRHLLPGREVVALHGSHLRPQQAIRMTRFNKVVVATDPNGAGDRIAQEISDALGRYSKVVRCRPPEGEDCSSVNPDWHRQVLAYA